MNTDPRERAVAESYPTFWDKAPDRPPQTPVAPEDAYSTFVDLAEDDFPAGQPRPEDHPHVAG